MLSINRARGNSLKPLFDVLLGNFVKITFFQIKDYFVFVSTFIDEYIEISRKTFFRNTFITDFFQKIDNNIFKKYYDDYIRIKTFQCLLCINTF